MRRKLPGLLMVWPYVLSFVILFWSGGEERVSGACVVSSVVLYAANVVNAFRYPQDRTDELVLFDALVKVVHIPFYILMVATGMALVFTMDGPVLSPGVFLMYAAVCYLTMITSSMYGVSAVTRLENSGRLDGERGLVYLVLHLSFLTDVFAAAALFRSTWKRES